MKLLARLRRWLHLMGHLVALPFVVFAAHFTGTEVEIHRAADRYQHETTPNRFGLKTISKHVWMGCSCGQAFWPPSAVYEQEGPHG